MKSTATLLLLVIIAECFGAHERSRQRSGPIRSVPVAADVKRQVNFDCPEEFGYYPHPTDCTLYYVCVFGGALLESCTGGLMYSHELQTCDWPRNVGCDATGPAAADDLERLNEREPPPPPPPPRRNPPPQRVQPNPVITSRGQPKFNRQEYEKQQQLYAEVEEDLPPVDEIENDRQQRVYRGQPSTIGQVQKDRDGYGSQAISSGRTLNSNLIQSSLNQNTKLGSFSFGTQIEEKSPPVITQAPQSYNLEPTESVKPSSYLGSPRPKMLYNASQAYSPDQYDPYYAIYDEDGELYKDSVQQTYRGTPPSVPARRPVEYTPSPVSPDDYDDALIQGPINNQNQYQSGIRQSTRSSDENQSRSPVSSTIKNSFDESNSSNPSPPPVPVINISSLAKPFRKTDNIPVTDNDLHSTQVAPTYKPRTYTQTKTLDRKDSVEIISAPYEKSDKKIISLTTGFSIRRNSDDNKNPYTLTYISKPLNTQNAFNYNTNIGSKSENKFKDYYDTSKSIEQVLEKKISDSDVLPLDKRIRRKHNKHDKVHDEDQIPYIDTSTEQTTTLSPTKATKYYLKMVHKRPATTTPSAVTNSEHSALYYNTESSSRDYYSTPEPIILNTNDWNQYNTNDQNVDSQISYYKPNNLRNFYDADKDITPESSSSTTTSTLLSPSNSIYSTSEKSADINRDNSDYYKKPKPSYYLYHLEDDVQADKTTEIFGGNVKAVLKSFLNDVSSTSSNELVSTPSSPSSIEYSSPKDRYTPKETEKTVHIGFQKKKKVKYADEKPIRNHYKHLEIITEPSVNQYLAPTFDSLSYVTTEKSHEKDRPPSSTESPAAQIESLPLNNERNNYNQDSEFEAVTKHDRYLSKFSGVIKSKPKITDSRKYHIIVNEDPQEPQEPIKTDNYDLSYNDKNDLTENSVGIVETVKTSTEPIKHQSTTTVSYDDEITTTTVKSTTTQKIEKETKPTKSLSFPTRASRINPAIKLAATSSGGGRRSYQSSSNCSSDNSLQDNPKCNEIKYQRPSSTRGRGSAHYSTSGASDVHPPNRGTPPTRTRPTLKPSTAIVSKTAAEIVDIYTHPPSRPSPVYPQPTPDKTAAKCRKDVCLLPDCFCGGKDIPGDLPVDKVPQMVLLTFDDSVNDLNKQLYSDLFEKGRVNPNGCPISATFYVSHEWTDYSQVQNLYAAGHEMASHTVSHSFGEQFSQKKWNREVGGQREILSAYGGVKLEDVRGMRAPFLSVGGNKMFKMLYDSNFTYDSSLPVYENKPPSWPYTLDYKLFHDCMIPPCPTKSYPGVWEVPMVMWQDLNGGRCSMGDACANPPDAEGVYKMILKNFDRHYTSNRAPFGLFYHAAWFTQPHHKEGFIMFLDFINQMQDVWIVTNWQALQWVRDPTPISRLNSFQPFQCNYADRPKKCNNPKVCNLWHKSGVRYMRTCQPCPEIYPWTGKSGIRSSRIDNEVEE
ncbi:uncharacterized protein LOC121730318 isoform X2 [Aricia agestis]|uniref:uncharacterized protein LOC121730318 isoform X2 n=1 Tax=Aricia agestis TaxID=91739 RepID=UPI001C202DB4|nr:uncharacterized protein LOC121730318 isoform X2 [Aricia agestis]